MTLVVTARKTGTKSILSEMSKIVVITTKDVLTSLG